MRNRIGLNCPKQIQAGFTLIEILVVVVIIAILATTVALQVGGAPDEARIARAKQDIKSLETALDMYRLNNFNYPSTVQGLESLVNRPSGQPEAVNWRQGGYIKSLPKDPWGRPYQYLSPGVRSEIDVFSFGKDGQSGGSNADSDIGNWSDS